MGGCSSWYISIKSLNGTPACRMADKDSTVSFLLKKSIDSTCDMRLPSSIKAVPIRVVSIICPFPVRSRANKAPQIAQAKQNPEVVSIIGLDQMCSGDSPDNLPSDAINPDIA